MKAIRWHARNDVRFDDVPEAPPPAPDQIRIQVEWCGICATDVEEYLHGPIVTPTTPHPLTGLSAPMIMGHEVSGTVLDVGSDVRGLRPDDLVALDGIISCGECPACMRGDVNLCPKIGSIGMSYPGGLAERMTVPAATARKDTTGVGAEAMALAEPFSVAVHALRRGRFAAGDRVAVIGAGTIGLAALQVARALGAESVAIIEPVAHRRERARTLGASITLAPDGDLERLLDRHGLGPDLIIDCTGNEETPQRAARMARPGGRLVLVGLPVRPTTINYLSLIFREIEMIGSAGHVCDTDFATAVRLICDRAVDAQSLVTHRLPLAEAVSGGFDLLAGPGREEALKILVGPREPRLPAADRT